MPNCEQNILTIPVVVTEPALTDMVMFTSASGNTVMRSWATIRQFINGGLSQQPPTANAGVDATITAPTNLCQLTGAGASVGGSIVSYGWAKVSGPGGDIIAFPSSQNTSVSSLVAGNYIFRLTVVDNLGVSATDTMQVTVNPAAGSSQSPPTVNAGVDASVTLPTNSLQLTGTASSTGTIASYLWEKVSGPAGGAIAIPTAASTQITGLAEGVYVYRLTATDDLNQTGNDTVQVTVNAAGGGGTAVNLTYWHSDTDPYVNGTTAPTIVNGTTVQIANNANISIMLPAAAQGKFIGISLPSGQTPKVSWNNGTEIINSGVIPDQVWRAPFTVSGVSYYLTRIDFTFNETQPLNLLA